MFLKLKQNSVLQNCYQDLSGRHILGTIFRFLILPKAHSNQLCQLKLWVKNSAYQCIIWRAYRSSEQLYMYCFSFLSKTTIESNGFIFKHTFYIYVFTQYNFFFHFADRQGFLFWWPFLYFSVTHWLRHPVCPEWTTSSFAYNLLILLRDWLRESSPLPHLPPPPKFCRSFLLNPFFCDPCTPFQLVLIQAVVASHKYCFQMFTLHVSIISINIKWWWWLEESF